MVSVGIAGAAKFEDSRENVLLFAFLDAFGLKIWVLEF
jgi:hypothetical protein